MGVFLKKKITKHIFFFEKEVERLLKDLLKLTHMERRTRLFVFGGSGRAQGIPHREDRRRPQNSSSSFGFLA